MEQNAFSRTELIIGKEALHKLKNSKVVVLGIGGVGSFVVESLVRAGVGKLVLVDNDTVSISNINRQIIATIDAIGKFKVEVMKERILRINPNCNVEIHAKFISEDNISEVISKDTDYVVDAIDTVSSKIATIMWCKINNINIISSMGTGNKLDPTKFEIVDIFDTKVCPLARVMRYELKRRGIKDLKVLYSEEKPIKLERREFIDKEKNSCKDGTEQTTIRKQIPGSISFVPSVAGMIIGGEVIKDLIH